MDPHAGPPGRTYLGIFLVALATVMYEIILTRIFSVTMWYHFAFVAISAAMFGTTVGSLGVYLRPRLARALPLGALLVALAVFGGATPAAIRALSEGTTPLRIVVSVAILCPLGVLMGTAFPLGMSVAASGAPALGPWLWGINGATSVCASVLAVALALGVGISTAFWSGFACYAVAAATPARLAALDRRREAP